MSAPTEIAAPRTFGRAFWLAMLVAALVVVPRTWLVSRAHSEYWDDQYHLRHGLALLTRTPPGDMRQDAPLGQALVALPLWLGGIRLPPPEGPQAHSQHDVSGAVTDTPPYAATLYLTKGGPEELTGLIAVWKALLFLPFAVLVFHWCRQLYGVRWGWRWY